MAAVALLPPEVCTAPIGIVLTYEPIAAAVTLTEIVQDPTGMVLPDAREMADEPLAAVTTPPHVVEMAGVAATTTPAGKVSVKIAVSVMAAAS